MIRRVYPALSAVCLMTCAAVALRAEDYRLRVIASGLSRPTGIALEDDERIYFTQVPTPGVAGGRNSVSLLNTGNGRITVLHQGEPEPVNITVGRDGDVYWTCRSAGVILRQDEDGVTSTFLSGLARPTGISASRRGRIYFTQVPTPGVAGGMNGVFVSSGAGSQTINMGEPEPVDVAVSRDGDLYWTCRTAGVILTRNARSGMTTVLLSGLDKPVGIAIDRKDRNLYFTEVPTPAVPGAMGGRNKVWKLDLRSGTKSLINSGDPEPTDVAVDDEGNVYWTCTSAGVIVQARPIRRD